MVFQLPNRIGGQAVLPFLSNFEACKGEEISVDFNGLQRITPTGLAVLATTVLGWRKSGVRVDFVGLENCRIKGYLQRMNLMKICGIDLPEEFLRHDSANRFVPLRPIDHRVEEMGKEIAGCLAPGGVDFEHPLAGLYDFAWYVLTETANNTRQHGQGFGCATAQVSRGEGLVRLAIADNGKGILRSFRDAGLEWSLNMSDAQAIQRALDPKVSCKGEPTNQGVGLTLVAGLARLTGAWMLIVSGSGVAQLLPGQKITFSNLSNGGYFQGTLVSLAIKQNSASIFTDALHQAKLDAGLLRKSGVKTVFKA